MEYRFSQTPDGAVWTSTTFPYPFWERYLEVFDEVNVIARAAPVPSVPSGWRRVDGPGVHFSAVPYYVGPLQFLKKRKTVKEKILSSFKDTDAIIMRMGSVLGGILRKELLRRNHPFAVEVVADPYDVFAPGAFAHPLRPYLRIVGYRKLRRVCRESVATAYVTRDALQRRYPGGEQTHMAYFSDVEIPDAAFVRQGRTYGSTPKPLKLIMVGGLNQLYKAPHILVDAMAKVVKQVDAVLTFVGDGKHRPELAEQAKKLGIADKVIFRGELTGGKAVLDELDRQDVFVLPSFQEGLPRAMVEAMARGLPCVGSTVGGIPELLGKDDVVPPGDAAALAAKIVEVAKNPGRLAAMSARNVIKAQEYTEAPLRKRRVAFYRHVRSVTEGWLRGEGRAREALANTQEPRKAVG